jgi:hypothetical protein
MGRFDVSEKATCGLINHTFLLKFKGFFHRRDAESAKDNDFMFTVERTVNIKVNPPHT